MVRESRMNAQDWLRRNEYEVSEVTSQRMKWAEYVDVERKAPNEGWMSVKIELDVVLPTVRGSGGSGGGGNGGGGGGGGGSRVGASADASAGHTARLSVTLGTTVGALLDEVLRRLPRDPYADDHVEQVAERHVFKVRHRTLPHCGTHMPSPHVSKAKSLEDTNGARGKTQTNSYLKYSCEQPCPQLHPSIPLQR